MAGDWIKMRTTLADDPDVIAIAYRTGLDPDHVVGKLHRFWSWADGQSRDGHAPGVTAAWLDQYVRVVGFAEALQKVGWLEVTEDGLSIPGFDVHMSKSAKSRALTASRQQSRRASVAKTVTHESRSERDNGVTREEKRREEKIDPEGATPPAPRPPRTRPPVGDHQEFIAWFSAAYQAHHRTPPVWGGKEVAAVKRLLKQLPLEELKRRGGVMFSCAPAFPAEHPDLATLAAHINKFTANPRASPAVGHFKVTDEIKYRDGEVKL